MKPHAVVPSEIGADRLRGWVLCHDVPDGAGRPWLRKGAVLDAGTARRLAEVATREVHLVEMEPGDLHEDPAGERLAAAVAADGVRVRDSSGGQWALVADRRGLLRVAVGALARVNALEGLAVYTLYDGQIVDAGEVVAKAKVTPLVIPERTIREAESRCRAERGLVAVRGFRAHTVAAVAPASLEARARHRFEAALREKTEWFGATLGSLAFVEAEAGEVARAIRKAVDGAMHLVIVAGTNALDPLDPVFDALERLDARTIRRGVPAHPGSLVWVAVLEGTPILGMPSCGMFSQATMFDLLLPRLLAGERLEASELAAFGHGGLLNREMAFRFPPYRPGHDRGALPE